MQNVITSLTTTVTADALWGVVGETIPFLGIAILFALGYRIYKKLTNGVSKGKVKS